MKENKCKQKFGHLSGIRQDMFLREKGIMGGYSWHPEITTASRAGLEG